MRNARAWGIAAATTAAAAAIALGGFASANPSAQQPTFRGGTGAIVSLFTTVLDKERRLVPDLTREDFEVLDNDKPQPLVLFESEVRPITVVVMLDTSVSMTNNLELLFDAAEQFLIRLFPGDKAKVGAFNDKIEVSRSEFSDDRDALVGDLRGLDYGNATRLWDAVAFSLDELKGVEGRRVILLVTDGEDAGSQIGHGTVMTRARDEDVMVYAIGMESEYFNGQQRVRTRPDGGLQRLAEETGGGFFLLRRTAELSPTFTRVAQEIHSQYVLGFEAPQLDGRVHRVAVRVKKPGMTARARRSYLATPERLTSTGNQ
jgi:Ca-activated chloride channel family protein